MANRPYTRSQVVALIDPLALPALLVPTVLQQAGPHTRLVCHAWHDLHPPVLALAPCGLTTPEECLAALAALPPTLTSLDLSAIQPHAPSPITATVLATIPTALPQLQQIQLPSIHQTQLPSVLTTILTCPHLHTLAIDDTIEPDLEPSDAWAILLHPPACTRLRSLTIPLFAFDILRTAPPGTFPRLTAWLTTNLAPPLHVAHLATLARAAPALQSVRIICEEIQGSPHHLTSLTTLTALHLEVQCPNKYAPAPLLHLGSLTGLRSLTLSIGAQRGWIPAEATWLPRLTLLTHLDLSFCFRHDADGVAASLTDLAATVPRLPQLNSLCLHFAAAESYQGWSFTQHRIPPQWLAYGQPCSIFHHLAAATQLHQLHLQNLPLPSAEAHMLSRLTGLTALTPTECICPPASATVPEAGRDWDLSSEGDSAFLQWVPALTNLQQLTLRSAHDGSYAKEPQHIRALAKLQHLHTLQLHVGDVRTLCSRQMAAVLAALGGRLRRLQLACCSEYDQLHRLPPSMLACMTNLQVLDVSGLESESIQLPASLRQCYVKDANLQHLRAQYPLVAFKGREESHDIDW